MTLRVVFGYGGSYESSVAASLQAYNEIEGHKTFHHKDTGNRLVGSNPQYVTEIWFTLTPTRKQQNEEKYEFVGHQGIDPNDPNWREKWEALNQQAAQATEQVLDTADQHAVAETVPTVEMEVTKAQE